MEQYKDQFTPYNPNHLVTGYKHLDGMDLLENDKLEEYEVVFTVEYAIAEMMAYGKPC